MPQKKDIHRKASAMAKKPALVVWLDWSSTGVWVRRSDGGLANMQYKDLGLPAWLIERFDYWSWWYNRWEPWSENKNAPDDHLFTAYGLSLAMDLKLWLGDRYEVFFREKEEDKRIELPLPESAEDFLSHRCPPSEMDQMPRHFLKGMLRTRKR